MMTNKSKCKIEVDRGKGWLQEDGAYFTTPARGGGLHLVTTSHRYVSPGIVWDFRVTEGKVRREFRAKVMAVENLLGSQMLKLLMIGSMVLTQVNPLTFRNKRRTIAFKPNKKGYYFGDEWASILNDATLRRAFTRGASGARKARVRYTRRTA